MVDEDENLPEDAEFLTLEQTAAYGRYSGPPTVAEFDQFFVLDDEDRKLIGRRRRDSSRLGSRSN